MKLPQFNRSRKIDFLTFDDGREFSDVLAEIHLAGTDTTEEGGFVMKEILRTGEWPVIPTKGGLVKKPLKIVRDGKSSAADGVIAMAEVVENFKAGALDRVQIPLSKTEQDHTNTTRNNTGYVRDIWIQDGPEGSKLVAKMEFTEPDVKEKVLRGTYADVSCGIPWGVTSRGKQFGSTLEHVCITNRPFIDGLGPFLAASDQNSNEDVQVAHFGDAQVEPESVVETPPAVVEPEKIVERIVVPALPETILSQATSVLEASDFFKGFEVVELADQGKIRIRDTRDNKTWIAPYELFVEDDEITVGLSAVADWAVEEVQEDEPAAPVAASAGGVSNDPLTKARRLRELRLSQPSINHKKEARMPLSREELAALELSDDARAAIQSVLDENATLSAATRTAEADRRVDELKDLGLSERPGFLKLYRNVMLSDDGGPAVVLSNDTGGNTQLSALQILDQAVEALAGSDQKVHLSDQALVSGNDEKPPADANAEKSVEERTAEAKQSLYGNKK